MKKFLIKDLSRTKKLKWQLQKILISDWNSDFVFEFSAKNWIKSTMFKDGEVFKNFNNKKQHNLQNLAVWPRFLTNIIKKCNWISWSHLMTPEKFAVGYMFLNALYLPPKIGTNGLFAAFLGIFRLNGEVLNINCLSRDWTWLFFRCLGICKKKKILHYSMLRGSSAIFIFCEIWHQINNNKLSTYK